MRRITIALALFSSLPLAACSTAPAPTGPGRASAPAASPARLFASSAIESRWAGRPAGEFFARFAPPVSDSREGSLTVYNWRGGYNRIKRPDGSTANVSCSARISVSEDYRIRRIAIVSDRPGATGPSYCTELLTAQPGA